MRGEDGGERGCGGRRGWGWDVVVMTTIAMDLGKINNCTLLYSRAQYATLQHNTLQQSTVDYTMLEKDEIIYQ